MFFMRASDSVCPLRCVFQWTDIDADDHSMDVYPVESGSLQSGAILGGTVGSAKLGAMRALFAAIAGVGTAVVVLAVVAYRRRAE